MMYPQTGVPSTVTSTGAVKATATQAVVIVLRAGSDAATVILRDTDGSGDIKARLIAPANTMAPLYGNFKFPTACHATLSGTGPAVDVYEAG